MSKEPFFFPPFITVSMYLLQVVRFLGIHVYFAENISLDKNLYEFFFLENDMFFIVLDILRKMFFYKINYFSFMIFK
jgi:hypothetical protein